MDSPRFIVSFLAFARKETILIVLWLVVVQFTSAQEIKSARVVYDVYEGNYSNEVMPAGFGIVRDGIASNDDLMPRGILLEFKQDSSYCGMTEESKIDVNQWSDFKNTSLELSEDTFYDSQNQILLNVSENLDRTYYINNEVDSLKWIQTDEIKKILGYTCYKAERQTSYTNGSGKIIEVNYTVWFTSEIPLPYGPYNHVNLPGLVLEVQKTGGHTEFGYLVREIILNPPEPIHIDWPLTDSIIERNVYKRILRSYLKNQLDMD